MKITSLIKSLTVGESAFFALAHRNSVMTICTRLARHGMGTFSTNQAEDRIKVTRLTEPSAEYLDTSSGIRQFRSLRNASLNLREVLKEFEASPSLYKVSITPINSRKSSVTMLTGSEFPVLVKSLLNYIDIQTKNLKP